MARVTLTPGAARELDKLLRSIRLRALKVFERLERWPNVSGAKALAGDLAGYHRIRTGDYRILFRVRGAEVVVERVGHRDGFYDE
jgi:mRNA-degrading endonuclease RelE of RelBE toxin-antitoxin system